MKFKKRNIQIVDHSTGQTLDFPTFGKQAGEEAINELEQNVDNKIAELKSLVGTPLKASTASAMNNRDKIYVYTGNETGYTNGHWYYYDGTNWSDGGVYNSTAVETDKTLSVENVPADAKKTGDEINKLNSDLSQLTETVDTVKDNPVALAEQLDSNIMTVDQVPYAFRKTPRGVGNRLFLDKIVGGTIRFNQLADVSFTTTEKYDVTITNNSDGSITVNGTATASSNTVVSLPFALKNSHVYMNRSYKHSNVVGGSITFGGVAPDTGEGKLWKNSQNFASSALRLDILSGESFDNEKMYPKAFDLTDMFGNAIANMIYDLEQETAGAGVKLFDSMFPNDFYSHNTGSLESVQVSGHKTYNNNGDMIGSYPIDNTKKLYGVLLLDANSNIYCDGDEYASTGNVERRYAIKKVTDATISAASPVRNQNGLWCSSFGLNAGVSPKVNAHVISDKLYSTGLPWPNSATDGLATTNGVGSLVLCLTDATSGCDANSTQQEVANAFKAYLDILQPTIVFELNAPTTESAEPFQSMQICDADGTEEFVSTGIVPVGHYSEYPEDQVAKLDGLPKDFSTLIAPTEKTTTASRNYTAGSLLIMGNVLYKATANIANGGTITPGTNCTATTLAEIISALA